MTNQRHLRALEFPKILELCAAHAISREAKEAIRELTPSESYGEAERTLDETASANQLSVQFGNPGFYTVEPIKNLVGRGKRGALLSPKELLQIARVIQASRTLDKWYQQAAKEPSGVDSYFRLLNPPVDLEKEIVRCLPSEDEIADNASSELSNLRRKIRNAHQKARDVLEHMTRSQTYASFLQEQIVTIRNGRFVIPVRAEYRNEIKGLVHDISASGSTIFIEPMTVVDLNNSIKELEAEQQNEINRILLSLSAQAGEAGEILHSDYEIIIALDVIFAKSKLADQMKAVVPKLVESGETNLQNARHPLIPSKDIVPIHIYLGGAFDTLVITGPNTGGKTVALKTLGLLTLMASSGLMIPAGSRSSVRFFKKILVDIGDEQSIEQSLSTFSGHMTNIITILKMADKDSLVLIDELGAGTDPVEGAALAVAILSQLRKQKSVIAATTHYAEMKVFALQTQGVENASCEFDVSTLRPTYRLLIGTPGRSNAFAISQRLGLPSAIVDHAQELVSTENQRFEDVVSGLEETRQELETERGQAQVLRQQAEEHTRWVKEQTKEFEAKKEKILSHAQDQARSLLERVRYQSDQILLELEDIRKEKDKEGFSQSFTEMQRRLREQMGELEREANPVRKKSPAASPSRPIKSGDHVFLLDFNTTGVVLSPPDSTGNLRVQSGILETRVPLSSVELVSPPKVTLNGGSVRTARAKKASSSGSGAGRLDLRGLDSSEAALELDRFIDRSVLSGLNLLTIVHGKGTGVLREMVGERLARHPQIESYRLGGYGEGGDGVTIAELT